MKHSKGVSLLQRAPGPHRYRDENAPGEKRYLRRRVRHMQKALWQRIWKRTGD